MYKKILAVICAALVVGPLSVMAADELIVGGDSIGIQVSYDGVMITGTYAIQLDGVLYDPKDHGVHSGDIITEVNEAKVTSIDELYEQIANYQDEVNVIPVTILRGPQEVKQTIKTIYTKNDQTFQSGLYVKDSITGVGTTTFYDPEHQSFGALGHEIIDSDTRELAEVHKGTIFPADITSISAAQENIAGEKHARILFDQPLGSIDENTHIGIYGTYSLLPKQQLRLPWAKQEEVHTGEAQIYTVLDGTEIKPYQIEITKLHRQKQSDVKGIEFTVTDENLLSKTNGIIQGMSGSPIIQDGKIIGAITHVITSDPLNGYGVYIEWMLQEANQK